MILLYDKSSQLASSFQQTVEQIEVIREVVLQEVSKLTISVTQKRNNDIQYSFLQKNHSRKIKMDLSKNKLDSSLSANNITSIDRSFYKIIDSSILQEIRMGIIPSYVLYQNKRQ